MSDVQQLHVTGTTLLDDTTTEPDVPYNLFIHNDPVTPMMVVTRILKMIFGFSTSQAHAHMLTAHQNGKAVLFTGPKSEAESYCVQLHSNGLMATVAKDQ
jgi:ATP-dependent Clp protease adaptor protein ClpS